MGLSRGLLRRRSLSVIELFTFNPKGHAMREVYIGIDAHKETNKLAYAFGGRDPAKLIGSVSADLNRTLDALRKFQKKHDLAKEQLHI